MKQNIVYTEANIKKLLESSFDKKYQLNKQLKDDMLQLLEQKVAQKSKDSQSENKLFIGLSVIWIAISIFIFSEKRFSIYMLDLIKLALGLSIILIPFSSIILIIIKIKVYAKKMV
ncbi:MAG: hypothetical protein A2X12_06665 [Bacteroidetes bacterium GWE2_29_8]|nr:MAG: hypothetical protein A2X12_06665 [Bacteroidetes bacterium GWE2_29_8]OFY22846.1 MAG: hypothetical protein A2X02_07175 [Bacteroidetes bacterium GWF2_29_10]